MHGEFKLEFTALFPRYAIQRVSGEIHLEKLVAASFIKNVKPITPLFSDLTNFEPAGYSATTKVNVPNIKGSINHSVPPVGLSSILIGTLNGVLQILNLQSVQQSVGEVSKGEFYTRLSSAIYSVTAAIIETSIMTIGRITQSLSLPAKWVSYANKNVLPQLARIGAIFGLLTALWDVFNGFKQVTSGDVLEGIILAGSGILLGFASVLFYFNLTNPIGWALLILGVGLSLALTQIKFDEIEKWLIKSFIGERYVRYVYWPYRTYQQQQLALSYILEGKS